MSEARARVRPGPGGYRTCRRDGAGSGGLEARPGWAGQGERGHPGPRSARRPGAPGPRAHGSVGTSGPRAACCHLPSRGSERSGGRLKCPLPARLLRCGRCVRTLLWVFLGPCITDGNYRRLFFAVREHPEEEATSRVINEREFSNRDCLLEFGVV